MRNFLILALALFTVQAHAALKPTYFDFKPQTQQMIEYQLFTNLSVASSTAVYDTYEGPTSAAALSISSGWTNPDSPRNLVITPTGTIAQVGTCAITVSGTDYLNNSISEVFNFTAASGAAQTGSKAFKTLTSVAWAASCESSTYAAKWNIGIGEKIGVKRCMDQVGRVVMSTLNGAKEATAPTMVVDDDEVSKNTADFNGTMNGANDFELFFIQNFRCVR